MLPGNTRIVLSEYEPEVMLKDALRPFSLDTAVVLALGPEGGWTEEEVDQFRQAGWRPASLGNTILRVETAAIAALAVVVSESQ